MKEITKKVLQLLENGKTNDEIFAETKISYHQLYFIKKRYKNKESCSTKKHKNCSKKYNWQEIQKFYDEGNSYRDCNKKFGISLATFSKAINRGDFKQRNSKEAIILKRKSGKYKKYNPTEEHKKILSESAKKRCWGGDNQSKKFEYNGFKLCSSYELRVAKLLDVVKVKWIKPKTTFQWIDNLMKSHTYHPDFYLPELNIYLDPKNSFCIVRDTEKISRVESQNGVKVLIIPVEQIKKWEKDNNQIFKDLNAA